MRNNRKFTLMFVIGMILSLGLAGATFAAGGEKKKKQKRPKKTGILSVTTTPSALPVKVDGQMVGMSGVGTAADFYLTPGLHLVEIESPDGQVFRREINVVKNVKNCICLNVVETVDKKPCPYDIRVDGPETVTEGSLATFVARNISGTAPPLNYKWSVSPASAVITTGAGTSAITVDTTGLAGRTLTVELDVNDGVYDATCAQRVAVDTFIPPPPPVEDPVCILFDEFPFRSFDDDKARLDNLAIEMQNSPSWNAYIIMYQGTDRRSKRSGQVSKLSTRALDYLVKVRGVDPSRITVVRAGARPTTTYQFWLCPPGAELPTPN